MKFLKQGLSLALLGAGLAALPATQTAAAGETAPASSRPASAQQLRSAADGRVTITRSTATGHAGFVRVARGGDLMPTVAGDTAASAVAKATAYVTKYAAVLGAGPGELVQSRVISGSVGRTITFTQQYKGLPVYGAMIKANVDKAGDLTSVNGFAAPDLNLSVTPRVSATKAGGYAVATVEANPPGTEAHPADTSGLRVGSSKLLVYRLGSTKGAAGRNALAWQVQVTNGGSINDAVFVDAATGKLLNRYSSDTAADFGTDRELYDQQVDADHLVWKDGDAFPGALTTYEQNLMYDAGNSYWLYANTFGYDSFDGAGASMVTVEDYPDPDGTFCPNAQWDGQQIDMCPGSESDDIVSHEWGHAYTQYTSGLIYQYQSGALNESYSDVWGETIDLINGREDGDEGDLTIKRPVGQCSTHSPAVPVLTINSPSDIAKDCTTAGASFGPQLDATGITGDVVQALDVAEPETPDSAAGTTTDGCSPYTNAAAVSGKIAIVDRGLCSFEQKAYVAGDAGASALIVGNREEAVLSMGTDGADHTGTPAPSVMIPLSNREEIKSALADGDTVNVTMKDAAGQRVDSYRWLVGEKGEVFGGALRDMWNPTCYGNAGKISDAEYSCGEDDNGGVHSNSGVPNHAYALLVDGGTYNGVTVPGIGLDKAANLWWVTQTAHLTPTSDFADFADGLDASCDTLVGQPIKELSVKRETPGAAGTPITAADCDAVSAMETAVQLRKAPTQCNYRPLLSKGAPSVCGKRFKTETVFGEDFEHGLKKWKKGQQLFFAEGHGIPWRSTSKVPGSHKSSVAFAPDPTSGSCAGDADDISSADSITSPAISVPGGKGRRLSFQHYVATETPYDGGNVKISVNGKKFTVVPNAAYTFNAPNGVLATLNEGNSDPLAGEAAFTGTDGGKVVGSWGTSIVDLAKAGVKKGDRIKVRFDMGRDGCGGVDGWYVDNVKVQVCKKKSGNRAVTSLGDHRRPTHSR